MTMPVNTDSSVEERSKEEVKELNFRNLKNQMQQELAKKDAVNQDLERQIQELRERANRPSQDEDEDDDDDSEPYVDKKRLKKSEKKFVKELEKKSTQIQHQTENQIKSAVQEAIKQEREQNWRNQHPDFIETMGLADKLILKDPGLAEAILEMPDNFERQKLVYKNIKALGLDKPEDKGSGIQAKIDSNRRTPNYQPGSYGSAPYSVASDFSKEGVAKAKDHIQDLLKRFSQ